MSEGQQRPRFIVIERHRPGRPPYLVRADPPPGAPRREPLKPRAEFWYRQDAEAFAALISTTDNATLGWDIRATVAQETDEDRQRYDEHRKIVREEVDKLYKDKRTAGD